MANEIKIEDQVVRKLIEDLENFQETGVQEPIKRAGERLKNRLVDNIKAGINIHGETYPNIKDTTNEREIAFSGPYTDTRKRNEVSSSPTPFNVTGETAKSIDSGFSQGDYEVYYDNGRTDLVLQGNARASGNVNKPRRDPVGLTERNPSDHEFDIVTDEIEKAIERLVNGF